MSMTRKDYVALAEAVNKARQTWGGVTDALAGINTAEMFIADDLASDNPRFDRARFLAACRAGGQS